jgi:hypothetical protein
MALLMAALRSMPNGRHTRQLRQKGYPLGPSSDLNLGAALAYAETTKSDTSRRDRFSRSHGMLLFA